VLIFVTCAQPVLKFAIVFSSVPWQGSPVPPGREGPDRS